MVSKANMRLAAIRVFFKVAFQYLSGRRGPASRCVAAKQRPEEAGPGIQPNGNADKAGDVRTKLHKRGNGGSGSESNA